MMQQLENAGHDFSNDYYSVKRLDSSEIMDNCSSNILRFDMVKCGASFRKHPCSGDQCSGVEASATLAQISECVFSLVPKSINICEHKQIAT